MVNIFFNLINYGYAAEPATPSSSDKTKVPPQVSSPIVDSAEVKQKIVSGDWLSTVAIEYYGAEGRQLWPYLCSYNQERGRLKNCDRILPGQEILLPSKEVLRCDVVKSFGYECSSEVEPRMKQLYNNLPPEAKACVDIIRKKNSSDPRLTGLSITLAKSLSLVVQGGAVLGSKKYFDACNAVDPLHNGIIEMTPEDYFTLDENGKPIIVDYWGPEDL